MSVWNMLNTQMDIRGVLQLDNNLSSVNEEN